METERVMLEGAVAVLAALEAASRPLEAVYIDIRKQYERSARRIWQAAQTAGVPVFHVTAEEVMAHAGGQTHGGVVAFGGPRRFTTLEALLDSLDNPDSPEQPLIAMLDGVEDPYNFGQALRAFYAAGVHGVVLPPRNWAGAAAVVGRASAGASERMPLCIMENARAAAAVLAARGLRVAAAARGRPAVPLYAADLRGPLFLLVGGEKRGISRPLLEQADLLLEIPYGRGFAGSLGTVAAAAVLAFEIQRQRATPPLPG